MSNRSEHRRRNEEHWNATLDAQNLGEASAPVPLDMQLTLAATADVRAAYRHLGPLKGRLILDLGGGLGLNAILLARAGARVVIADLSRARLREARKLIESLGLLSQVQFVCCAAEELPFRDGVFDGQITKSVLIHTDLPRAAAELHRTLAPNGRAAFIEPLTGNPFVNLYRRVAAPKIWQEITRYFDHDRLATLRMPFADAMRPVGIRRMYFLAFFATPFNYSLHKPKMYFFLERALLALDKALFTVLPPLRRGAWFAIVMVGSPKEK